MYASFTGKCQPPKASLEGIFCPQQQAPPSHVINQCVTVAIIPLLVFLDLVPIYTHF